jgi:hypothetical protein
MLIPNNPVGKLKNESGQRLLAVSQMQTVNPEISGVAGKIAYRSLH